MYQQPTLMWLPFKFNFIIYRNRPLYKRYITSSLPVFHDPFSRFGQVSLFDVSGLLAAALD